MHCFSYSSSHTLWQFKLTLFYFIPPSFLPGTLSGTHCLLLFSWYTRPPHDTGYNPSLHSHCYCLLHLVHTACLDHRGVWCTTANCGVVHVFQCWFLHSMSSTMGSRLMTRLFGIPASTRVTKNRRPGMQLTTSHVHGPQMHNLTKKAFILIRGSRTRLCSVVCGWSYYLTTSTGNISWHQANSHSLRLRGWAKHKMITEGNSPITQVVVSNKSTLRYLMFNFSLCLGTNPFTDHFCVYLKRLEFRRRIQAIRYGPEHS
jgi:hypothetical protein